MLCHAMPCHVMPCYRMLCYAILSYPILPSMYHMWQHFTEDGKELNRRMGRAPPSAMPYGMHRGGALPGAEAMGYAGGSSSTAAAVASAAMASAVLKRGAGGGGDEAAKRDRH